MIIFMQIPITLNLSHTSANYLEVPLQPLKLKKKFHSEPVGIFIIYLHTKSYMHSFSGSLVIAFKPNHKHRYPTAVQFSYSTTTTTTKRIKILITIENSMTLHYMLRSRKPKLPVMLALLVAGN
jgi:hypothetical protein